MSLAMTVGIYTSILMEGLHMNIGLIWPDHLRVEKPLLKKGARIIT
jgi:hypothetical protein